MKNALVVYRGKDEVIVTPLKNEAGLLKDYFNERCGRKPEDYDRVVYQGVVEIYNLLRCSGDEVHGK